MLWCKWPLKVDEKGHCKKGVREYHIQWRMIVRNTIRDERNQNIYIQSKLTTRDLVCLFSQKEATFPLVRRDYWLGVFNFLEEKWSYHLKMTNIKTFTWIPIAILHILSLEKFKYQHQYRLLIQLSWLQFYEACSCCPLFI